MTAVPQAHRDVGNGVMKVAVTGASGFIGRHVLAELARHGKRSRQNFLGRMFVLF